MGPYLQRPRSQTACQEHFNKIMGMPSCCQKANHSIIENVFIQSIVDRLQNRQQLIIIKLQYKSLFNYTVNHC